MEDLPTPAVEPRVCHEGPRDMVTFAQDVQHFWPSAAEAWHRSPFRSERLSIIQWTVPTLNPSPSVRDQICHSLGRSVAVLYGVDEGWARCLASRGWTVVLANGTLVRIPSVDGEL